MEKITPGFVLTYCPRPPSKNQPEGAGVSLLNWSPYPGNQGAGGLLINICIPPVHCIVEFVIGSVIVLVVVQP